MKKMEKVLIFLLFKKNGESIRFCVVKKNGMDILGLGAIFGKKTTFFTF